MDRSLSSLKREDYQVVSDRLTSMRFSAFQRIFKPAQQAARRVLHSHRFAGDDDDVAQRVMVKIAPLMVPLPSLCCPTDGLRCWTVRHHDGLHPNFLAYVRLCARREALSYRRGARGTENKSSELAVEEERKRSLDDLQFLQVVLQRLETKDRELLVKDACGELRGAPPHIRKALSRARRKARDLGTELG